MKPVRWGVLGAAKFARDQMAPAIHAARGAELTALATRDRRKADAFLAFCPALRLHDSYEALLADPEIEAVYIPLPHTLHVEWTLKALAAGKHVLVEKPVAMRAPEIDPLIAARDASGLLAAEAYMIVHHPQWHYARKLLRDGAIGTLRHVGGFFSYDNSGDPENIRNQKATGGGSLPDIGVYTCGAARWMSGEEPQQVRTQIDWENGVDVTAHMQARFPSFSFAATTSMRLHPRQEMSFDGEQGFLRLTAPFNPGVIGEARVELHCGNSLRIERFPAVNQYVRQVEAFGHSIRSGAPYPWTLENARGTQAMLDQGFAGEVK